MTIQHYKPLVIAAIVFFGLLLIGAMAAGVIYFWPLTDNRLQQAEATDYSYDQAISFVQNQRAKQLEAGVKPDCRSVIKTHGQPTAKAVLMLHGYTACPAQFEALAEYFYQQGYNVYIPLQPQHGLAQRQKETFTSLELVQFASQSLDIAKALGHEVGVVGLSAGGVLGTWLAEYRTEVVQRLLVLSPFYETSAERLPKWLTKPFLVLYGNGILPDVNAANNSSLSYRSLTQYVRITANFRDKPYNGKLKSVGSVVSRTDHEIDQQLAHDIPSKLASTNGLSLLFYQPPAEWNLGHDIVRDGDNPDIRGHEADLYPRYFNMYEGRQP